MKCIEVRSCKTKSWEIGINEVGSRKSKLSEVGKSVLNLEKLKQLKLN